MWLSVSLPNTYLFTVCWDAMTALVRVSWVFNYCNECAHITRSLGVHSNDDRTSECPIPTITPHVFVHTTVHLVDVHSTKHRHAAVSLEE